MNTPAIHYPKPQTLPHFEGPQQMPHLEKQIQEQPSEPPPITLDSFESIEGSKGLKLIKPATEYSDALATSLVGVLTVVSLVIVTLGLLLRR